MPPHISNREALFAALADQLRLPDNRAPASFNARSHGNTDTFKLTADNAWSKKYFNAGSPEAKARAAMAGTD